MNEQTAAGQRRSNPNILVISEVVLLIVIALAALSLGRRNQPVSQLLPVLPAATTPLLTVEAPRPVSLADLNADPAAYLNQPIQVSGSFLPLASTPCPRYSGPRFRWALVADNLQLDALGFERILTLLSPDTAMVVEGIWRLYQGPLGCGKGPAEGSAWYLQAQRIVQPNPLVGSGGGGTTIQDADPGLPSLLPTIPPTMTSQPTPTIAATEAIVPQATPTNGLVSPTATLAGSGTAAPVFTPTPPLGSVTATTVSTPGAGTATAPSATPGTPVAGGATATPSTPLPPTATETGGSGYPGEPTATTNPDPYP